MFNSNHWLRSISTTWDSLTKTKVQTSQEKVRARSHCRPTLDSLESRLVPTLAITQLWDDVGWVRGPVLPGMTTDDSQTQARVTIQGTSAQVGDAIRLLESGQPLGAEITIRSVDLEAGFVEVPMPALASGKFTLSARLLDSLGTTKSESSTFSFVVDTRGPSPILQGSVFHDANRNGVRELAEEGLANAQVRLYNADRSLLLGETLTSPGGHYLFDNSRLLPGSPSLNHGEIYRIEYTPPSGFGPVTQAGNPGFHTVVATETNAFLVQTVNVGKAPLVIRGESAHKSPLNFEYTLDGTKRTSLFGQTSVTISGADLSEPRRTGGFTISPEGWPGTNPGSAAYPQSLGMDNLWGQRAQEIAFIQNRWGNANMAPHEGAGLQMAIFELLYDQDISLDSGRFRVHGAGPKTNPLDANAAIQAARGFLSQAAGKNGTAIVLDATLGGQVSPTSGGLGHLVSQGFHFGALSLPRFTNPAQATFTYGDNVQFQFKASGAAATYNSFDLPGTLDLSPSGQLTGWVNAGTHTFTVEATVPGFASTQQEFTLVVQPRAIRHTVENRTKTFGDTLDINPIRGDARNQSGSAFLKDPVDVQKFRSRFDFMTHAYSRGMGDGLTFTIAGSNPGALGTHGSGLGYQGIRNSVAIKLDLINKSASGAQAVGLVLNGDNPSRPSSSDLILDRAGISVQPGKRYSMEIAYESKKLEVTVIDHDSGLMASQAFDVDLPTVLGGSTGHFGFTAGTGTLNGRFEILSWRLEPGTGPLWDFTQGIPPSHSSIQVNGSARLRDQLLILTGVDHALEIPTGIRGETLMIRYSGNGHRSMADAGNHAIVANAYDGKGRASNYVLQPTAGRITVHPRAVTIRLPNQTKRYGQEINLNAVNPTSNVNTAGSAFLREAVDFSSGFTTEFSFRMNPSSPGHGKSPTSIGDGITFTIQRRGPGALGKPAEGLGSQGITQSVSIKFDSFNNQGEGDNSTGLFVGGGNPSESKLSINLKDAGIDFKHTLPTHVSMTYQAETRQLRVTISQTWEGPNGPVTRTATQNYTIDLAQALGGTRAFFGFTGGTGTLVSRQEILGWRLGTLQAPGSFVNRGDGFSDTQGIRLNGAGRWEQNRLVLTGALEGAGFPVGVGGETLRVTQTSQGNSPRAAVGNYTITGTPLDGTGKVSNYRVTVQTGSLRVERANLVIRAREIQAVYGSYRLNENRDFIATGLAPGDSISSVRFHTNAKTTASGHYRVGAWKVTPFSASGSNFRASNYHITYEAGWLTIQRKVLTITANDRSKTYGETLRITGREFQQNGLVSGDRIDRVVFSATGDKASADAGIYPIRVAKPEGSGLDNYDFQFVEGTLTVRPRAIEFTVPNFQQQQGRPVNLNPLAPDPYNQAGAVWHKRKVDVTQFQTRFTFVARQLDKALADGFTFTIQNHNEAAVGGRAGGLGYSGIGKSVAIKFDFFGNDGEGNNSTGLFSDGRNPSVVTGSINLANSGIDLRSQNEFTVAMNYNGSVLRVEITDLVTGKSATQQYTVDIPKLVGGNQAWVGFTGGTGGLVAHQAIHKWSYRNAQSIVFDYGAHGWKAEDLNLAGSGRIIGPGIVLTGVQYGALLRTGVNNEHLLVWLRSEGNKTGAPRGTYEVQGFVMDGLGKVSNYQIKINPGKLVVN